MIWLTWRQHRAEAGVGAAILAAIATGLVVIGLKARHVADQAGLPACLRSGGDCGAGFERLHRNFHWLPPVTAAVIALPLLAGMFWGAPLISREFEAGTHRLAWTQSISRVRWLSVKLALILTVATGAALTFGLITLWALDPLTPAFGTRFNSTWFDIQGVVPAACMLFAFATGVAASTIGRRTIPAMAVTLLVYAAARIPVHFIRKNLLPTQTHTASLPLSPFLQNPDLEPHRLVGSGVSPHDWMVNSAVLDPSGQPIKNGFRALMHTYCPDLPSRGNIGAATRQACQPKLAGLDVRVVTEFKPASAFWELQAVESAIFVLLAAALIATSVRVVARSRVC